MILMLAIVVVFLGTIGLVKYKQIQGAIAQASAWQPPPEAVTTIVAAQETWPATLHAIGTVVPVHGVTVSADLPGIVARIAFDSGRSVAKGEVLVQLDTRQERAQLEAAQAHRVLMQLSFDRMRGLREKGVVSQAELDRADAEFKQADARVGEIAAMIERKTIRAPFAGILGIRQINLGEYLSPGAAVVPLQTLDPIYVEFAVPQQEVGTLAMGAEVQLAIEGTPSPGRSGRISAIDAVVDEATRNLQVQATFANPDGTLRAGMFVEAQVVVGRGNPVVALPASSIQYAPYGNTVFVVDQVEGENGQKYLGVRQEFVKLGSARGDQVAVVSGVKPGEQVVTSGVFKLRNGAAVQVNNEIQPANDPTPKPEDS
jgi:membrane fusion protein (multidrug efflux system)